MLAIVISILKWKPSLIFIYINTIYFLTRKLVLIFKIVVICNIVS